MSNRFRLDNLRGDVIGGITAAVVALPLALAFGVASGMGPISGLYGAIFVGFFAAIFGGTPAQVSGPTGPMTVVMTAIAIEYAHEPLMAFTIVMLGGAMQIVLGFIKIGRYISYMPFPVISGFMSGIGCIIIILQLAPFFGHTGDGRGVIETLVQLPSIISSPSIEALALGCMSLVLMFVIPKKISIWAPPPLIALIIGTLLVTFISLDVPTIGSIPTGIPTPIVPQFTLNELPNMLASALILALLGSIDSLLTSLVADNLTHTRHKSNKELIGQGIGNMVAGLFGGISGAGATMRTMVNVRAGGRTPLSGALHATILLALALGLGPLAEGIPLAVLAGILFKVGWDIIDWNYIKKLRQADLHGIITMLSVLLITIFVDLIIAVGVGIIVKYLLSAPQKEKQELEALNIVGSREFLNLLSAEEQVEWLRGDEKILFIQFNGTFTFASAKEISDRLTVASKYDVIVISLDRVNHMDTSAIMMLNQFVETAKTRGKQIILTGTNASKSEKVEKIRVLTNIPIEQSHPTKLEGLRHAADLIKNKIK